MARITGSSLDRVAACPASAVLPQMADETGDAAARGNAVHLHLENRSPELDSALRDQGDSLEDLWPEGGVHEAIVWYDPVTRVGGYKKRVGAHRDYSEFPEGFLVGTIDYLNPTLGIVDDLKTGTPPPPTTLQLGLASVALADGAGLHSVTASVTKLSLAGDPRDGDLALREAPRRAQVHHAETALVKADLDRLYADHLLNKLRVSQGAEPLFNPSSRRCRWCRAEACPKRM